MRIQAITVKDDNIETIVLHAQNNREREALTKLIYGTVIPAINSTFPKRSDDTSPEVFDGPPFQELQHQARMETK